MSARKKAVPNYRLHKPTGQAVVTVRTPAGKRRNIYLGKYNSPESRSAYNRVIAELEASPAAATLPLSGRADLILVEALLAFAKHATEHYSGPDGKITRELTEYRQAIRIMRDLYGSTPAREFGPLALKAVRQKMIESGLCRPVVNRRVARVRRIFKWLASEELVPATVFQSLTTVAGLQKGKTVAPEPEPVVPVADHVVRLTLPWLTPTIVLDVDSPGGSVFGTAELGDKIAAASKAKRTIAVANSTAASGAYWIASQAGELVVTPSGMVGSVGVYMMHVDRSEEMRQRGRAVSFVASTPEKTAANEFGPLDDVGRSEFERIVQGFYRSFLSAVARGRKTTVVAVQENFGKGGMLLAGPARSAGMVDRVATLEQVLAEFGVRIPDGYFDTSAAERHLLRSEAVTLPATQVAKPKPQAKPTDFAIEIRKRQLDLSRDQLKATRREIAETDARRQAQQRAAAATSPQRPPGVDLRPRTPLELRRSAVHEAGHAVVALARGMAVHTATVEQFEEANGYITLVSEGSAWDMAVMACAGAEAETVLCREMVDYGLVSRAGMSRSTSRSSSGVRPKSNRRRPARLASTSRSTAAGSRPSPRPS